MGITFFWGIILILIFIPWGIIKKYKRLINYIPTFCTSVGVLFSFLLLFFTLSNIKTENLSEVVKQLSSKFLYSIIGISFSIIWTIIIKIKEEKDDNAESQNNIWKQKDPQEILWLLLQTNSSFEQKFDAYTKYQNDNNTLVQSTSNELLIQLKSLNSYTSNIKEAIDASIKSQTEKAIEQQETLDKIFNIMESAGDSLKGLLDDLKNQLGNNIKAMGSDATEKAAELHRIFEDFLKLKTSQMEENMANEIKEVHGKIRPALNSISEATNSNANELKEALNNINLVLQDMQISLSSQVKEQFQAVETNVENHTKKFEEITISKANDLSTEFDKIHSVLQTLNNGLQSSIDNILKEKEEQIRKTFDHLEELRGRSETVLTQTTKEFALSVEKYSDIQQNNEEIIKRLETQIKSIDNLQETSIKNIDHWNSKVDKMEEVKNRVADIANTIGQLENINKKLGLMDNHNN